MKKILRRTDHNAQLKSFLAEILKPQSFPKSRDDESAYLRAQCTGLQLGMWKRSIFMPPPPLALPFYS